MSPVNGLFDRSGSVPRPSYRLLLNEAWSLISYRPAPPDPGTLPSGRGHVVLVIPAFLTPDAITKPLRQFLMRCGYRAFGWNLGINWGPTPRLLSERERREEADRFTRSLAALAFSLLLMSIGLWLAEALAMEAKLEDCLLQGRMNCERIELRPAP